MIERYTRPEMGKLWTLEHKFRTWLEVELAVTRAWYDLGVVPEKEWLEIKDKADFDLDRILELEDKTKHDVIAFLTAIEEKVGPASRYIHLGCTSSDIVDTANGVLLQAAGKIIANDIDQLLSVLQDMTYRYKGLLMMGRTHGVHAEPMSFGQKLVGYYAEFARHRTRWRQALEDVRVGKISGAVGNYAHLSPELEKKACRYLGLRPDPVSTQIVQRDRYAHYFSSLAQIAGSIERLSTELRHLQRTEVLEVEEGFSKGQKGSSAMPHKKNPISAENLCGLSRIVRSNSLTALENMPLWHERDISHSSAERVIMPDSTILINYMLQRLSNILSNLVVKPESMQRNLNSSYGLYFSQRLLLGLLEKGLARQKAYELVQGLAMKSWEDQTSFENLVREDDQINAYLNDAELEDIFDPDYYLRFEEEIIDRVINEYSPKE